MYSPYAHSYLCWGKDTALKRHRARLINAAINTNRTTMPDSTFDPCLARGLNDTLSVASIFHSGCSGNKKQRFTKNINTSLFTFVGIGNATQCEQSLISLFDAKRNDKTANCSYKKDYCTFDHTFQPKIPSNIDFIGLSGYYYIFNNLAYGTCPTRWERSKRCERSFLSGMNTTSTTPTGRYEIKDFPVEKIKQRLTSVVSTLWIIFHSVRYPDPTFRSPQFCLRPKIVPYLGERTACLISILSFCLRRIDVFVQKQYLEKFCPESWWS